MCRSVAVYVARSRRGRNDDYWDVSEAMDEDEKTGSEGEVVEVLVGVVSTSCSAMRSATMRYRSLGDQKPSCLDRVFTSVSSQSVVVVHPF